MRKKIDNKCRFIIIGGAEDKNGKKKILKYVSEQINSDELLLIATVASECPNEAIKEYKKIFKSLGLSNLEELYVNSRNECLDEKKIELVKRAKLIFFTGGDQLRITSILGGTPLYYELKNQFNNGCIYVGTSAGASVVSETMVVQGEDDKSPSKCYVNMSKGLGLIKDIIIDQHFAQRGRIGRLLAMVAQNPENLGIGIDEDTAIIINSENMLEVIGSGAIYIVDGRNITYSNVSEQEYKELLSMYNVKLHVLTPGKKYDLLKKVPFEEEI
ncbi:cyanophycinase [uncultured Clostridium sp.]|jgi:cyanophycinase|uniref:cyanophycinase n=1 Tax=uncultured Clostridium sp. TaxID=59620 RepID=UPI00262D4F77|nr:cyanophycinase [uncultured Clostridium sp.]